MRKQLGVQSALVRQPGLQEVGIGFTVYSVETNYFTGVQIVAGMDAQGGSPGGLQTSVNVFTLKLFGSRFVPSVAFTIVVSCIVASQAIILFVQFAKAGYSPLKFITASGWRWLDVVLIGLNAFLLIRHLQILDMVNRLRANIIANGQAVGGGA